MGQHEEVLKFAEKFAASEASRVRRDDREVAAKALEDAAEYAEGLAVVCTTSDIIAMLRARAEAIRKGEL
jgi:hypothetical protein